MVHFDRCAPYLEAALRHGDEEYTLEEVRERCADGRMQFWPGERFAMVTSIIPAPRTNYLHVFLLGGDFAEFSTLWPVIAGWAKTMGCSQATALGRKGWARHLAARNLGWAPSNKILMEAPL